MFSSLAYSVCTTAACVAAWQASVASTPLDVYADRAKHHFISDRASQSISTGLALHRIAISRQVTLPLIRHLSATVSPQSAALQMKASW